MNVEINQLEKEFVEFMSVKKKRPYDVMEEMFLRTREEFRFRGAEYEALVGQIIRHFRMNCDIFDEESAVEAYQFYSFMHLLRYLSYSHPKTLSDYLYETFKLLKKGHFKDVFRFGGRKIASRFKKTAPKDNTESKSLSQALIDRIEGTPVVVDYGSGLGYISLEIGLTVKSAKVYLVDIDCLVLEFAEFRFRNKNIEVATIPVNKENLYPKLPPHNICIATEVMEHICQPLVAYENIHEALDRGGVLFGNFEDHEKGIFHCSPDLKDLREKISEDFETDGPRCYRKIK